MRRRIGRSTFGTTSDLSPNPNMTHEPKEQQSHPRRLHATPSSPPTMVATASTASSQPSGRLHGLFYTVAYLTALASCSHAAALPSDKQHVNGKQQHHLHTPLASIEATMLTTAGADFAGDQVAYATATNWHEARLLHHHHLHRRQLLEQQPHGESNTDYLRPRSQPNTDFSTTSSRVGDNEQLAPYLACAEYKNGGKALGRLQTHLHRRRGHGVRSASHTVEYGACFLATATVAEASEVSNDLEAFGLSSFGAFPSMLKLVPGLLNYDGGIVDLARQEEEVRIYQQQQQRPKGSKTRLTTTHGYTMRHPNVNGLNVELSPGILPEARGVSAAARAEKNRRHPHNNDNRSGPDRDSKTDALRTAEMFTERLKGKLMSHSLQLFDANFWSDASAVEEDGDIVLHPAGPGALRAREWQRAAAAVREADRDGMNGPGEACGWDAVRFHHAGDDLLLVTGIDHLLPSTEPSIDDEDAKELQMACFMGLLAFLADRPEVLRVSSLHMPTTFNAEARAIIQSAGVEETPLSDAGLDGTGEVVQVVDSGIDETHCFFIDDSGEEVEHGHYFEEMAVYSPSSGSGVMIVDKGGYYPMDLDRRKIVQYVDLIKADVPGAEQPYGSGPLPSLSWSSASGYGEDEFDGHGTHTAGSVAGTTINSPAALPSCTGTQELGCVGSCLNESDITLLQNASADWDIDGYCPRFECLGGDESTGECLSDDTASVLSQHGGVARGAKLSIFDAASGEAFYSTFVGNSLWEMTEETGAKIHSNSWGAVSGCLHQPSAAIYDDYMYQNPEHLLIFAAGNSGNFSQDPNYQTCSMSSPAIAKNILAVGATSGGASRKATTTVTGAGELPIASDPADMDTVAWFSSRGPTIDNRIKPEVVAPGDQVFSSASDGEDSNSCRLLAFSGTSMACPLVAGAGAMIRQYFLNEDFYAADLEARDLCRILSCDPFSPSASTVKAILINSANVMGGSSEPDGDRGFGRVHLEAGMPIGGEGDLTLIVVDSGTTSIAEFSEMVYTFEVSDGTSSNSTSSNSTSSNSTSSSLEIRATLSWLDPAVSIYAAKQLQHDLDLNVISPSGNSYVMWQSSGLKDAANNNERVVVPAADAQEPGTWKVVVTSQALTTETQDYSLVITAGHVVGADVGVEGETSGAGGRWRGRWGGLLERGWVGGAVGLVIMVVYAWGDLGIGGGGLW